MESSLSTNSDYNKGSKTVKGIVIILLISEIIAYFSGSIEYAVYYSTLLIDAFFIIYYKKINKKAFILACFSTGIMLLGTALSSFGNISNNNYLYCIAYGLNVITYVSISELSSSKLDGEDLLLVFKVLLAFALFACVYNVVLNIDDLLSLNITTNSYGVSFSSFYYNRNTFASILCFYSVGCMYLIMTSKKRMAYIICYCFILLNIIASFSRDSILFQIIFITLVVFTVNLREKNKFKLILKNVLVLLVGGSCIYFVMTNFDIIDHFIIRSNESASMSIRTVLWRAAFNSFKKEPFAGLGGGAGEFIVKLYLPASKIGSIHNSYLEILLDGGICFAIIHILFIKQIIVSLKKIRKHDNSFYIVFATALFSFGIYSFFESTLFFGIGAKQELATILFFVIPIIYSHRTDKN